MKTTGNKITTAIVFVLTAVCIITVDAQPRARAASSPRTSSLAPARPDSSAKTTETDPVVQTVLELSDREGTVPLPDEDAATTGIRSIRTVDFYLKSGKLVFGKLISEDRNKVIVEQIEGSTLIVATYSKRDIESRSLQAKNVSASKYYTDMAEYFAGRTWDFKDDPDDFIQAIRFYQRAKQLIEGNSQLDLEKSKEMDRKVAELEADREVWTKQVESRAKLKELEFQAEYVTRFTELEAKVDAGAVKIETGVAQIDAVVADVKKNTETLDKNIPTMELDLRHRLDLLAQEIDATRRLFDPYGRSPRGDYGYRPRY
jgi:phage regulator Rha-like protein